MRPQVWKRGNNPKNLILEVRNYMFEFGEVALVRLYRATEPKFSAPGIRHCKGKEVFETDWSATSDDLVGHALKQTLASISFTLDLVFILKIDRKYSPFEIASEMSLWKSILFYTNFKIAIFSLKYDKWQITWNVRICQFYLSLTWFRVQKLTLNVSKL